MYLERFKDISQLNDYLNIITLAVDIDFNDEVPQRLANEMKMAFNYTVSLPQDYDLTVGNWVLYALYSDNGEIIGTIAATEDGHFGRWAQVEYIAVHPDWQHKGCGKFMLTAIRQELRRHCKFDCIILTTVSSGKFYEKCGMTFAGRVAFEGRERLFFAQKI